MISSKSRGLKRLDVTSGTMLTEEDSEARLASVRFIAVGKQHSTREYHRVQLKVAEILHKADLPVAIGMEMFRRDSQDALNQWVDGNIEEQQFEKVFFDNWHY